MGKLELRSRLVARAYPVEVIDDVCAMLQSGKSEFSISAWGARKRNRR